MTADNWGFVLGAYGLAAVAIAGYWCRLVRRERLLGGSRRPSRGRPS